MARRYWLMKCEPAAYTIDDLAARRPRELGRRPELPGAQLHARRDAERRRRPLLCVERRSVRRHRTRRDRPGRLPRPLRLDQGAQVLRQGEHRGVADLVHGRHRLRRALSRTVPLDTLKETKGLEKMMVTQKGSRLRCSRSPSPSTTSSSASGAGRPEASGASAGQLTSVPTNSVEVGVALVFHLLLDADLRRVIGLHDPRLQLREELLLRHLGAGLVRRHPGQDCDPLLRRRLHERHAAASPGTADRRAARPSRHVARSASSKASAS